MQKDLATYLYGEFKNEPDKAQELAAEYHKQTEEYDLTVCTGPMGLDGILPATSHEFVLINKNARKVLSELYKKCDLLEISRKDLWRAIGKHRPK